MAEAQVLVDTGWPGRKDAVVDAMRWAGFRPQDIAFIILTHHHPDHAGNAAGLKQETGSPLLAHPADAPVIEGREQPPAGSSLCAGGRLLGRFPHAVHRLSDYPAAEVDSLLEEGMEVEGLPGTRVLHVPGHTPGSLCLHNEAEGWLMAGDALSHMFGLLWLPTLSFSWDPEGIWKGIEKIASTGVREIHFGHGPPLRGNPCERLRRFLRSRARLRRL